MRPSVPPLLASKVFFTYWFEDRNFISIIASSGVSTPDAIQAIEDFVAIKKSELAKLTAAKEQP